jgi:multiple sugar transport system permease protein
MISNDTAQGTALARRRHAVGRLLGARLRKALLVFFLLVFAAFMVLPFFWVFATSLRLPKDSFNLPPSFLPTAWFWQNYEYVFTAVPFLQFIINSIKITLAITFGQLLTASMAAYAFARMKFKGSGLMFVYLLSGLMIPYQSIIIAQFLMVSKMGLLDTHWAVILPYLANPFSIFLMRQFMRTIPRSYDEAALIDGANKLETFWHVILPMSVPSLMVCSFLTFIYQWNNFFSGLIYLNTQVKYTLPMGIQLLKGYQSIGSLSTVLAGVMLSLVVPAVVYGFGQKYLIQGTVLSGLKS